MADPRHDPGPSGSRLRSRVFLGAAMISIMLASPEPVRAAAPAERGPDLVVLLHGLSRTPRSMRRLERALAADGYAVLNLGYPSGRQSTEASAAHLAKAVERSRSAPGQRVHFVTHSLGGIVVRSYLQAGPRVSVGRVVMLGPPNRGSELVDLIGRVPGLRRHMGASRGQLGTGPEGVPARLLPVDFELGVIAGRRSLNPLFSWIIPGPDDGIVSVERARVEGMVDFLVVPRTHTFMMRSPEVIRQTAHFLKHGRFTKEGRTHGSQTGS